MSDPDDPPGFPAWGPGAGKAGWLYGATEFRGAFPPEAEPDAVLPPEFGNPFEPCSDDQLAALRHMSVRDQIAWHDMREALREACAVQAKPVQVPAGRCLVDVARRRLARRLADMPEVTNRDTIRREAFRKKQEGLIADGSISANCGCPACRSQVAFEPKRRDEGLPFYRGFRP